MKIAAVLLRLAAFGALLASLSAVEGQRGAETRKTIRERFHAIGVEIETKHKLSPANRKYLTDSLNAASVYERATASLWLGAAVRDQLFPEKVYLGLIERKTIASRGVEPLLYDADFRRTLGLASKRDNLLNRQLGNLLKQSPESIFDAADKGFILECLNRPEVKDRTFAASLLFSKRGLSSGDLQWALDRLKAKRKSGQIQEKRYWNYVERVIKLRSKNPS